MKHIVLLFLLLPQLLFSQIGGESIFSFIDIATNAHVAALGGKNISLKNGDVGIAFVNPSLLDSTYNNSFAGTRASHFESFTDISHGTLVYAHSYKGYSFFWGMQYVNYGFFDGYDEYGNSTESFSANDFMFAIGAAKPILPRLTIGASFKPIYSQLESYKSFAIATDYSATYNDTASLFTASILIRNVGSQIVPYIDGNYEPMPWGIDIGFTKKLKHAPFRFSLTYHNLQQFDTYYEKPNSGTTSFDEEEAGESNLSKFASDFLDHLIIGTEILLFQNMYLAGGYNFKKGTELAIADGSTMTGFSFGFGLKLYKFHVSYGHETYHASGGTNLFSLRCNFNEFVRKSQTEASF